MLFLGGVYITVTTTKDNFRFCVLCYFSLDWNCERSERRMRTQQMWCSIIINNSDNNNNSKHELRYYCRSHPWTVGELLEKCLSGQRLGARITSEYSSSPFIDLKTDTVSIYAKCVDVFNSTFQKPNVWETNRRCA